MDVVLFVVTWHTPALLAHSSKFVVHLCRRAWVEVMSLNLQGRQAQEVRGPGRSLVFTCEIELERKFVSRKKSFATRVLL